MTANVTDQINAAAQPYMLDGGQIGILLIHGFGGIPGELRTIGDTLNQLG
jgi:carboxylesterase